MSWLIFVAVAVLFDVFRIFTDNYISDVYYRGREVASQKMFSAWGKTIVAIISSTYTTQSDIVSCLLIWDT